MMQIIKVNKIDLTEKDIIEITNYKDFLRVYRDMFNSQTLCFELKGMLYLIGIEVTYCCRK